ncbi:hypothetical protein [Cyanobacterium sp. uoEpiScrs1]|uniref:hypothetical protein n=1 Tax=Cyanobacterium sp. uoEpiScrs1 TaxID=2976343 RepID=UPI00226A9A38|nr:hypothetical protein [Cyanobacterium sp. uoEpiScrs1]
MPEKKLSQEQLIFLLEVTARQLSSIIEMLKKVSPDNLPDTKLVTTVEVLAETAQIIAADLESALTPKVVSPNSYKENITERDKLTNPEVPKPSSISVANLEKANEFKIWWNSFLNTFRLILPSSWNTNLSNGVITIIIVSVPILIISTSTLLLPLLLTPSAENTSVTSQPKVADTLSSSQSIKTSQPVETSLLTEQKLTPEQNLVEAIRHDTIDLVNQYPEGLIELIKVNFKTSRLIITLGNQWYQLTQKKQDTLAGSMFKHSQRLNFRKLDIIDFQGNLIARSPVVGKDVIIFSR